MSASARRSLATEGVGARAARLISETQAARNESERKRGPEVGEARSAKLNVFVAADNRLLREALARMLMKRGDIEVTGMDSAVPLQAESVAQTNATVLLLTSRGTLNDDLLMIRQVRTAALGVRILLGGMAKSQAEFLQCVRAGS